MGNRKIKIAVIFISAVLLLLLAVIAVYPTIEFQKNGKLYVCAFNDDFSEFEENPSYNELYFYNEQRDISIKTFDVKKFLCFHVFVLGYEKGDLRKTQFVLEEQFINYWLENAVIEENLSNIDVADLIKGKQAVVGNTRYTDNPYDKAIYYVLDGKSDVMYVFESDGLTVIQVGSPDECPKYIAYK